jgi:hypothetical protein
MLVGDPSKFALESAVAKFYERLSFRALGFFVIHLEGRCYGVRKPDATMLACSFDEVGNRINERGKHNVYFSAEVSAGKIADAYRCAIYSPNQETEHFFGILQSEFRALAYSRRFVWAPDGDAAFDDGSHVIQFDVGDRVRLIGFKGLAEGYHHAPDTLSDVWLKADEFYSVLQLWHEAFEAEWKAAPKIPKAIDGAENC